MIAQKETYPALIVLENAAAEFHLTGSRLQNIKNWRIPDSGLDIDFFAAHTPQLEEYLLANGYEDIRDLKDDGNIPPSDSNNWKEYQFKYASQGVIRILRFCHAYPLAKHIDVQLLTQPSFEFKKHLHENFGYIAKTTFPMLYSQQLWEFIADNYAIHFPPSPEEVLRVGIEDTDLFPNL